MAIYHLAVSAISRSAGRSATGAAAYRSATAIRDQRTELLFDYRRKRGVEVTELVLPAGSPEWAAERPQLWNQAELAENRKNSTVAREFVVALPNEISPEERLRLTRVFTRELVERYGVAADIAIHAPHRQGDQRNWHAHILCSTRRLTPEGFTEKTRVLDSAKTGSEEIKYCRELWAVLVNGALERAGQQERVDHRSHAERGLGTLPTVHEGPRVRNMARRGMVVDQAATNAEILAANVDLEKIDVESREAKAQLNLLRRELRRLEVEQFLKEHKMGEYSRPVAEHWFKQEAEKLTFVEGAYTARQFFEKSPMLNEWKSIGAAIGELTQEKKNWAAKAADLAGKIKWHHDPRSLFQRLKRVPDTEKRDLEERRQEALKWAASSTLKLKTIEEKWAQERGMWERTAAQKNAEAAARNETRSKKLQALNQIRADVLSELQRRDEDPGIQQQRRQRQRSRSLEQGRQDRGRGRGD